MKKLLMVFVLASLITHINGCGGGGSSSNSSGTTGVTINVGGASASSAGAVQSQSIPSTVSSIRFTISASDMTTITRTVSVVGRTTISESFDVPNGSNRYFLVEALNSSGSVIYRGSTTADLNGTAVTLTISMSAVGTGTISGSVKDAVTSSFISSVTVEVYSQNSLITSSTTDSNGSYSISVTAASGYTVKFTKSGYLLTEYNNVTVTANTTTYLEAVLMIDTEYSGTGNVSGTISDALTGAGVSGLTINLRSGINVTSGSIVTTTTTISGGSYSFTNIDAGHYTAEASGSGYTTAYFTVTCVGGTTTSNQNAGITPILSSGETRIVLTWGATPSDLDSHLTGPYADGSGSRFHVYYSNLSYLYGETTYAYLDHDDISSYGPETITIYHQTGGTYRYSVHDYSNSSSSSSTVLSNSGAQVKVYRGSSLVATYNVPANQGGTLWTVFEMSGDTITSVNTMSYQSSPGSIQSTPFGILFETDTPLMIDLPPKE